jgi:hypothetical protein
VGIRAGIGISTNLGRDLWWKSLGHVILRLGWGGGEMIKFEKDLGSFFMMFFALRAKNIECHQHVVIQKSPVQHL